MVWLEEAGLRKVAERAGVDRRTARRYVAAAEAEDWVASPSGVRTTAPGRGCTADGSSCAPTTGGSRVSIVTREPPSSLQGAARFRDGCHRRNNDQNLWMGLGGVT